MFHVLVSHKDKVEECIKNGHQQVDDAQIDEEVVCGVFHVAVP